MPGLTSRAQVTPGRAQAFQSPFAVGPMGRGGGFDFGGLLQRQMAMREQMQRLQMARIQQEMSMAQEMARQQKLNWLGQREAMSKGRGFGRRADMTEMDQYERAQMMADAIHGAFGPQSRPFARQLLGQNIQAIGPQAAQAGLMQTGQLFADPGGVNVGVGGGPGAFASPMGGGVPGPGGGMGSMTGRDYQGMLWAMRAAQPIQGQQGKEGGRVPKTGTYKLHKDEVVVPKKAADVMFPYAGRTSARAAKGKPLASYEEGKGFDVLAFLEKYHPYAMPLRAARAIIEGPRERGLINRYLAGLMGAMGPYTDPTFAKTVGAGMQVPEQLQEMNILPSAPPAAGGPGAPIAPAPAAAGPAAMPAGPPPGAGGTMTWEGPGVGGPTQFGAPGEAPRRFGPMQPGQELGGVEKYTGPPLSEQVLRSEELTKEYREKADYHFARANVLQTYADDGRMTPELKQQVSERQQSAAYWTKRADDEQKKVDRLRGEQAARDMAQLEANLDYAQGRMKVETEAQKERKKESQAISKDIMSRLEEWEDKGKVYARGRLAPYAQAFAEAHEGETYEGVMGKLDEILAGEQSAALGNMIVALTIGRYGG